MSKPLGFSKALILVKNGYRAARAGWNGNGMWIALQLPDKWDKMHLPYIYMSTAQGELVPWVASQSDILADDWHSIDD